jgi:hypothetical protein
MELARMGHGNTVPMSAHAQPSSTSTNSHQLATLEVVFVAMDGVERLIKLIAIRDSASFLPSGGISRRAKQKQLQKMSG